MKMVYETPMMEVEQFQANEFCASCVEVGAQYKFVCDAGKEDGGVWQETNGIDGFQMGGDNPDKRISRRLDSYSACGAEHWASTQDDFVKGYYLEEEKNSETDAINVIIWRGENHDNVHCTTNLDITKWEKNHS